MTKLPEKNVLDGSKTPKTNTREMKTALGDLRDYLSDLLGTDSSDKEAARIALGIDDVAISSEKLTAALGYIPYDGDANVKQFTTKNYVDEAVQNAGNGSESSSVAISPDEGNIIFRKENGLYASLELDETPVMNSVQPVASGGVYGALEDKADAVHHHSHADIVSALGYTPVEQVHLTGVDGVLMYFPSGKEVVVTYEGSPAAVNFAVPNDTFEKLIFFTSGATPTELNISGSYKTVGHLTVEANKSYVLSILNKVLVMGECIEAIQENPDDNPDTAEIAGGGEIILPEDEEIVVEKP